MAQRLDIHPENPQPRLVRQLVDAINRGAVIAYPTDSSYGLGCHIGDNKALDRIRRLRGFGEKHYMTLLCADESQAAQYAQLNNAAYRLVKAAVPGPYTFVLPAKKETPRRLQDKRKTVGIRVPDNAICQAMLAELGEPLLSCTALLPDDELPLADPDTVEERLDALVDVIVHGGNAGFEPTTIVDLSSDVPSVIRHGKGNVDALGL